MSNSIMRECKHHGLTKFIPYSIGNYLKGPNKGKKRPKSYRCFQCCRERTNRYYAHKKKQVIDQMGGQCIICGYNECIASLEFHHLDRSTKEAGISDLIKKPLEIIMEEANKCVLVCRNCHGEIEYKHPSTLSKLENFLAQRN